MQSPISKSLCIRPVLKVVLGMGALSIAGIFTFLYWTEPHLTRALSNSLTKQFHVPVHIGRTSFSPVLGAMVFKEMHLGETKTHSPLINLGEVRVHLALPTKNAERVIEKIHIKDVKFAKLTPIAPALTPDLSSSYIQLYESILEKLPISNHTQASIENIFHQIGL